MKAFLVLLLCLVFSFANSQSCWEATERKNFGTSGHKPNFCKLDSGENIVVYVHENGGDYSIEYKINDFHGVLVTADSEVIENVRVICGDNEIKVAWLWYRDLPDAPPPPARRRLLGHDENFQMPALKGVRYATYSIENYIAGDGRRRLLQNTVYEAFRVGAVVDLNDDFRVSAQQIQLQDFIKTENGVAALIWYKFDENSFHDISVHENLELTFTRATVNTANDYARLLQKSNGNFVLLGTDRNDNSYFFTEEFADTNIVTRASHEAYDFSADVTANGDIVLLYKDIGLKLKVGETTVVLEETEFNEDYTFVYTYDNVILALYYKVDAEEEYYDIHFREYDLDLTEISSKTLVTGMEENYMSVFMTPTSGAVFFQQQSNSFDVQELSLSMTCSADASSEGICHPEKQTIETTAKPFFASKRDQSSGNSWELEELKECTLSDGSKVQGFVWYYNQDNPKVLEIHVDENTTPTISLDYVAAFALTCVQNRISVVALRYDGPPELDSVIDIFLYEKDGTQVVTERKANKALVGEGYKTYWYWPSFKQDGKDYFVATTNEETPYPNPNNRLYSVLEVTADGSVVLVENFNVPDNNSKNQFKKVFLVGDGNHYIPGVGLHNYGAIFDQNIPKVFLKGELITPSDKIYSPANFQEKLLAPVQVNGKDCIAHVVQKSVGDPEYSQLKLVLYCHNEAIEDQGGDRRRRLLSNSIPKTVILLESVNEITDTYTRSNYFQDFVLQSHNNNDLFLFFSKVKETCPKACPHEWYEGEGGGDLNVEGQDDSPFTPIGGGVKRRLLSSVGDCSGHGACNPFERNSYHVMYIDGSELSAGQKVYDTSVEIYPDFDPNVLRQQTFSYYHRKIEFENDKIIAKWHEANYEAESSYGKKVTLTCAFEPPLPTQKVVKQTLQFTGLTKTVVESKKEEIKGDIATSLGVSTSDVTITSITEITATPLRRRLLMLSLTEVVIEYEVNVADDAAASALKTTMASSTFTDTIVSSVATTTNVPMAIITVSASTPTTTFNFVEASTATTQEATTTTTQAPTTTTTTQAPTTTTTTTTSAPIGGPSPSPPPTTTTAAPASDDEGLGVGAIVGISAGAVAVVGGVVWLVMRQNANAGYEKVPDTAAGRIDL